MRTFKAAGALALLALAFPAAAMAHHGTATASCTAADYDFAAFKPGAVVQYKVTVDDVAVAQGDLALTGPSGKLHVPLTVNGNHTVKAYAWWARPGEIGGSETTPMTVQNVTCMEAPPAPVVAPTAAAVAPVTAPTPVNNVAGVTAVSPARVASLRMPSGCQSRTVRVTVAGRSMRSVAFSINGRPVKTLRASGRRSIIASLPLRRTAARTQAVTARVTFSNGARARTLTARVTRCSQAAVAPTFTG